MFIDEIALRDFRNYPSLRLAPGPGLNIFYGDNAQGKTNLLEAVYLCCLGRSHRTSRDGELIRHGQKTAYASVRAQRDDGPRHVEVLLSLGEKKRISVSGAALRRMSELMGHVQCVLFSPEDLLLVKGGPSLRRRFLDASLCQLRPAYFLSLARYNALVLQRNALLKQGNIDESLMDTFDAMLSEHGAAVVVQRHAFVRSLAPFAQSVHQRIAPGERLLMQYKTQVDAGDGAREQLATLYRKTRRDDMRRMRTLSGPHRDDLALLLNDADARAYASQGQQRTIALSLKLACVDLMRAQTGQAPVLMLDDVLSELDEKRQKALLGHVRGQVFITAALKPEGINVQGRRFLVHQGTIQPAP